ncbi:MAG TPA: Gfo/Idh/MocA family oxidoreductase [Candidatus Brocadiia bacterium]|nr:Gfo/Idh/MocA family oxidoreductase [Candidatus Brocadiia bacterium]
MANKLRVGLIGCGGIMYGHVQRLLSTGKVDIVAMMDPIAEHIARHKAAAPAIKDAAEFKDYKKLLAAPLDAVCIASPHVPHANQIVDSLKAGLHVLCEKPMVTSIADAKRVLAAEKKSKKVLLLSYQRHYHQIFRYLRRVAKSGQLGEIQFIQALQCQDWKRGVGGTWRQDPKIGGFGQILDSGAHLLDILMWTMDLRVTEVSAFMDNCETRVDINSAVAAKFSCGAVGNISIIGNAATWWEDITVGGSEETIFIRNGQLQHKAGRSGEMITVAGGEISSPDHNFVDCILNKAENMSPSLSGLRVIELVESAAKSSKAKGKPVRVPYTKA